MRRNLIYNISYQILAYIAPILTTPYISRVLGASNIGKYSYGYSIAYYFVLFTMLGLNNYGNRQIAKCKGEGGDVNRTFCEIYYMQLIAGSISTLCYILFGLFIRNQLITWLFLPYVISASLDVNWYFFGIERFDLTVIRNTIIKLLTIACIFIFVNSSNDLYVYTIILSAGYLLSQLIMWTFLLKDIKFIRIGILDIITHFKGNIILFIPIIAVSLYKIMDKIMLGYMSEMSEEGFYESSEKVIAIPMGIVTAIGTVMLPRISTLAVADKKKADSYFNPMIFISMIISSSLCFGMMAIAPEFVPLFYGGGYEKCVILYDVLLPSTLFLAYSNVIRTQYLIPYEKDIIFIKSVFGGAIINLIFNSLLIPNIASVGAAIGTLLAEAFVAIYQTIATWKMLPQNRSLSYFLLLTIDGFVMFLCINHIYYQNIIVTLILKIIVGALIYILLVLFEFRDILLHQGLLKKVLFRK